MCLYDQFLLYSGMPIYEVIRITPLTRSMIQTAERRSDYLPAEVKEQWCIEQRPFVAIFVTCLLMWLGRKCLYLSPR